MDTQIFFFINGNHTALLDSFFYLVSQKAVWIPLYMALLYAVWRNYSWKGVITILLMIGIGMLITDWANAHFLRPYIGRMRPSNPDNPIAHMVHIVNGKRGHGFGFPSCHSANIWLLTLMIIHWFRDRRLSMAMVVTALLVCYSRVYLGYHYPGDILGGFILAYVVMWIIEWIHEDYLHFIRAKEVKQGWIPVTVVYMTFLAFLIAAIVQ